MKGVIEQHSYPGFKCIIGLPFLIGGSAFLYFSFTENVKWANDQPPSPYFIIPFCSVFIILGLILSFGRSGFVINPLRRTVRTYMGILIPLFNKRSHLDDYKNVIISREIVRSKQSSYNIYEVKLLSKYSDKQINLCRNRDYLKSKAIGETIAKECKLDLHHTFGDAPITPFSDIILSYKDRVKSNNSEEVIKPQDFNPLIKNTGSKLSIIINPDNKIKPIYFLKLVPSIIFSTVLYFFIIKDFLNSSFDTSYDELIKYSIYGFFVLPIIISFISILAKHGKSIMLEIDSNKLVIIQKVFFKKRTTIPINKLMYIEISDDTAVNKLSSLRNKNHHLVKIAQKLIKKSMRIYGNNKLIKIRNLETSADPAYIKQLIDQQLKQY